MMRRRRLDLFHDEIISRIISCVAIHRLHVNNTAHSSAAHHRPQPPLPATNRNGRQLSVKLNPVVVDAPSPPSTPSTSICLHTGTGCLSPIIAWWRSCSEARSVTRNYRHLLPWPGEEVTMEEEAVENSTLKQCTAHNAAFKEKRLLQYGNTRPG